MMIKDEKLWIAKSGDKDIFLYPKMANRHGLITGASGTGKTVTLRVLAESFSAAGIPVFFSDMKGDVGRICEPGDASKMGERAKKFGYEYEPQGYPTRFWDVYGETGTPIRATMSSMGPVLLSRLMGLSEVQADVLNVVFSISRNKKWEIINTKDLRAILQYVNDNKDEFVDEYGTMATQSIGAIQRSLRSIEESGGDIFFGEPAIDIKDWMKTNNDGYGYINVLNSEKLSHNPTLYATFMMWMMSELFDKLPEAGDVDKPKLVFFFDEAHMLFTDAPKSLVQKIEQMVKLIRSKGVGIYFVSQSPSDIPDTVLAQLSNRVQHALRAYTPAEQKAVKAAATAFRANPAFKTQDVITELGVGEALISCLDDKGTPSMVERAFILPPQSRLGALDKEGYDAIIKQSPYEEKYREVEDRQSAYEKISNLNESKKETKEEKPAKKEKEEKTAKKPAKSAGQKTAEKAVSSAATSFARSLGSFAAKSLFKKK